MIIDIVVLVVLLISAVIALLRGFIREILTIAGVFGGLLAAYLGGPILSPFMRGWFGVEDGVESERLFGVLPYDVVADALSYGSIFIGVVIFLSIVSHFLAETARKSGLGPIDRTFGFIFGLLRGVVVLGFLYLPVHLFVDQEAKETYMEGSKTHFYLEKTSAALASFIPADATENMGGRIAETLGAREKLEEIDLLKKGEAFLKNSDASSDRKSENDGYSEEFRGKMDALFQDKIVPSKE